MLITKIEAARRQIDAAIELYFHEGDELATHTLVGAAHILITDLSKAAKLESILDRYIVPGWRWKFEKAIRAPQNSIKHADTDAEASHGANTWDDAHHLRTAHITGLPANELLLKASDLQSALRIYDLKQPLWIRDFADKAVFKFTDTGLLVEATP
jgi:hypothetical protein